MNQATYFKTKIILDNQLCTFVLKQLNLLHRLNKTSYWSDLSLSMSAFNFKLKLI